MGRVAPFAYFFWHPWTRVAVAVCSCVASVVLYAEDPVARSTAPTELIILGPVVNLLVCASGSGSHHVGHGLFCFVALFGAIGSAYLCARALHSFLRRTLKLPLFGYLTTDQMATVAQGPNASIVLKAQQTRGALALHVVLLLGALVGTARVLTLVFALRDCGHPPGVSVSAALGAGGSGSASPLPLSSPGATSGRPLSSSSGAPLRAGAGAPLAFSRCVMGTTIPVSNEAYTAAMFWLTTVLDVISLNVMMQTMASEAFLRVKDGTSDAPGVSGPWPAVTSPVNAGRGPRYRFAVTLLQPRFVSGLGSGSKAGWFIGRVISPLVILPFGSAFFLVLVGVLLVVLDLEYHGFSTELHRVTLASVRMLCDTLVVMQDWEFPHFSQIRRIPLPFGFTRWLTGRWLNFGMLALTLVLDANTVRYHFSYLPERFGQHVDAVTKAIVVPGKSTSPSYFWGYSPVLKFICTLPGWIAVVALVVMLVHARHRSVVGAALIVVRDTSGYV